MAKVRLTRRGKIVVAIIIIAFVLWLFNVTTPSECKVDIDDMPQWCKEFLYP